LLLTSGRSGQPRLRLISIRGGRLPEEQMEWGKARLAELLPNGLWSLLGFHPLTPYGMVI
jgi:hypothetical protein